MRMGGSDNKGECLASQPRRYRVPGQPLLNRHQVGGVSHSPDGLFAQQQGVPTRGRPAVRGKGTTRAPLNTLISKIPFSFFAEFWVGVTSEASEVSLGRILGVLSIEPLLGGV